MAEMSHKIITVLNIYLAVTCEVLFSAFLWVYCTVAFNLIFLQNITYTEKSQFIITHTVILYFSVILCVDIYTDFTCHNLCKNYKYL
jgi:hypothetical protein